MNEGKIFEREFANSIPKNMYYIRIKDSASSFGRDSGMTRFTLKNPYDQFIFYNGYLLPMELKSTKGTSISIHTNKADKGKMIKQHQIQYLEIASGYTKVYPGFIFDYRESGNTYFMYIKDFTTFSNDTDKKSINEVDILKYNGILISKVKKKVHYRYDIKLLIDKLIERCKQRDINREV
jgi:penicillin-binding protein-related factor A (putative recombinase)